MFLSLILTIAGAYFLIRNISYLQDESKLRNYLKKSLKGKAWVNKLGIDKTVALSKKYFVPLGIAIAAGMLAIGLHGLIGALLGG